MRHLAEQSKVLKTRKIREAELASQRARIRKVERNMIHHTTHYFIIVFLLEWRTPCTDTIFPLLAIFLLLSSLILTVPSEML